MTCTISDLDLDKPVTVTWKDPDEKAVSDDENHDINQGTVNDKGVQDAVLTINPGKIASFAGKESFTYKCSVTSSQYPDSTPSSDVDVVANILTLSKFDRYKSDNCSFLDSKLMF